MFEKLKQKIMWRIKWYRRYDFKWSWENRAWVKHTFVVLDDVARRNNAYSFWEKFLKHTYLTMNQRYVTEMAVDYVNGRGRNYQKAIKILCVEKKS